MSRKLTKDEKKALRRLRTLAEEWPDSLWLFSAAGQLCVMRHDEHGERYVLPNGSVDEAAIVATIDGIENDGGDW